MKFTIPFSLLLAIIYFISDNRSNIIYKFSNVLFMVGLVHLIIGLILIVHNGGLFKVISFFLYKKEVDKKKEIDNESTSNDIDVTNTMSFDEFLHARYSRMKSPKKFMLTALIAMLTSIAVSGLAN